MQVIITAWPYSTLIIPTLDILNYGNVVNNASQNMINLMDKPIESIEIDFEDAKLPAYFIKGGEGKRPTLIAMGGFDSTMEEVYCWIGAKAVEYGWKLSYF